MTHAVLCYLSTTWMSENTNSRPKVWLNYEAYNEVYERRRLKFWGFFQFQQESNGLAPTRSQSWRHIPSMSAPYVRAPCNVMMVRDSLWNFFEWKVPLIKRRRRKFCTFIGSQAKSTGWVTSVLWKVNECHLDILSPFFINLVSFWRLDKYFLEYSW